MRKIFIGGPIQYIQNDNALKHKMRLFIDEISKAISLSGGIVFNAHIVESFGDLTENWTASAIATRDLEWMYKCDIFMAFLPKDSNGKLVRTDGTHIEIGWATVLSKKIIIIVEEDSLDECSSLLQGLIEANNISLYTLTLALENPYVLLREFEMVQPRHGNQ